MNKMEMQDTDQEIVILQIKYFDKKTKGRTTQTSVMGAENWA